MMAMVEGGGEQREKTLLEADFFRVRGFGAVSVDDVCALTWSPTGVWRRL
jgi:hypothetical protein